MLDSELIEAVCPVSLKTPKGPTTCDRCDMRIRWGKTIDRLSVRMLDTARGANINDFCRRDRSHDVYRYIYSHC